MKTEVITIEDLVEMGACDKGLEWVRKSFPSGVPLTEKVLATVPDQWLVWFASSRHPELRFVWAGITFRYESRRAPALAEFADKVTADNRRQAQEAAEAACAENNCGRNAARAAIYCDNSTSRAFEIAVYAAESAGHDTYFATYADGDDAARAAEIEAAEAAWTEMADISVRYLLME
jgi:hypothetical protein